MGRDSVVRLFTCFFLGKAEKSSKNASQVYCKGVEQLRQLIVGITILVKQILFTYDRLKAKKRRKRWVDFMKAKRAKHLRQSRL